MAKNIISVEWSASDLPPGLSFNTLTGTFSGTPTVAGEYIIPVTVRTNYGEDTKDIKINIQEAYDDVALYFNSKVLDDFYRVCSTMSYNTSDGKNHTQNTPTGSIFSLYQIDSSSYNNSSKSHTRKKLITDLKYNFNFYRCHFRAGTSPSSLDDTVDLTYIQTPELLQSLPSMLQLSNESNGTIKYNGYLKNNVPSFAEKVHKANFSDDEANTHPYINIECGYFMQSESFNFSQHMVFNIFERWLN